MLTLVGVVSILLLLPVVLVCTLLYGSARAAGRLRREARAGAGPRVEPAAGAGPVGASSAARRASLQGPPSPGEACDRCAMAAAAAVYLPQGRLLLCGHHGRQYRAVLQGRGAVIVGELSFPTSAALPTA